MFLAFLGDVSSVVPRALILDGCNTGFDGEARRLLRV